MKPKDLLMTFESHFRQNIIYVSTSMIFLTLLLTSIIIYQNNIQVSLNKYNNFTSEYVYGQIPYNYYNPFVVGGEYDQKLSSVDHVIYTKYVINNYLVEDGSYKIDVYVKQTTSNFIYNADSVDFNFKEDNITNIKKNSLYSGALWTQEDILNNNKVALIYYSTAIFLFQTEDVIGQFLHLGDYSYEIIGLLNDTDDVTQYYRHMKLSDEVYKIVLYTPLYSNALDTYINYYIFLSGNSHEVKEIIETQVTEDARITLREDVISFVRNRAIFESRNFFTVIIINIIILIILMALITKNYIQSKEFDYQLRRTKGMTKNNLYFLIIFQLTFLSILTYLSALILSLFISHIFFYLSYQNFFPYIIYINIADLMLYFGIYLFVLMIFVSVYAVGIISKNIANVIRTES